MHCAALAAKHAILTYESNKGGEAKVMRWGKRASKQGLSLSLSLCLSVMSDSFRPHDWRLFRNWLQCGRPRPGGWEGTKGSTKVISAAAAMELISELEREGERGREEGAKGPFKVSTERKTSKRRKKGGRKEGRKEEAEPQRNRRSSQVRMIYIWSREQRRSRRRHPGRASGRAGGRRRRGVGNCSAGGFSHQRRQERGSIERRRGGGRREGDNLHRERERERETAAPTL